MRAGDRRLRLRAACKFAPKPGKSEAEDAGQP